MVLLLHRPSPAERGDPRGVVGDHQGMQSGGFTRGSAGGQTAADAAAANPYRPPAPLLKKARSAGAGLIAVPRFATRITITASDNGDAESLRYTAI